MAKGNMLQGMARGKVGDVVFSRLNGEQISRVRNRYPKNPKTNAQLYQRAIMATVMQAYSAGIDIFDHAFEGSAVGAGCQRRFMSLNAKQLRSVIAADLAGDKVGSQCTGRVVAPGSSLPCGGAFVISEGTYPEGILVSQQVIFPDSNLDTAQILTLKQFCERNGVVEGDIYTIVMFAFNESSKVFELRGGDATYGAQFATKFAYLRLQIKPGATTDDKTTCAPEDPLSNIFVVTGSGNINDNDIKTFMATHLEVISGTSKANMDALSNLVGDDYTIASYGVIRSKVDGSQRSNATMVLANNAEGYTAAFGITSDNAVAAWKQGTEQVGNSDLILEGGDK